MICQHHQQITSCIGPTEYLVDAFFSPTSMVLRLAHLLNLLERNAVFGFNLVQNMVIDRESLDTQHPIGYQSNSVYVSYTSLVKQRWSGFPVAVSALTQRRGCS
jgi:hypothetical protein